MKVFTGKVPFSGMGAPGAMKFIIDGEHPERPDHPGLTETLWKLTQRCWDKETRLRPKMGDMISALKKE
jgi:hypothetical protein